MIHGVKVEMELTISININIGIYLNRGRLDLEFLTNGESLVWISGAKCVVP